MNLTDLPRRAYWRVLRLLGAGRASWNKQYQSGLWSSGRRSPVTVTLVAELCQGGRLVEFGCGTGELPHLLPAGSFSSYLGMDISDVAVARAQARAREAALKNCEFHQQDMMSWVGDAGISVILAEECLYYLKPPQIEQFLERASAGLAPQGRIIVIVHSAEKHAVTLDACRRACRVDSEKLHEGRTFLILAARMDAERGNHSHLKGAA